MLASPSQISQHFRPICSSSSELLPQPVCTMNLMDRVGIAKRFSGSLVRPVGRKALEGMTFSVITEKYRDSFRIFESDVDKNGVPQALPATKRPLVEPIKSQHATGSPWPTATKAFGCQGNLLRQDSKFCFCRGVFLSMCIAPFVELC